MKKLIFSTILISAILFGTANCTAYNLNELAPNGHGSRADYKFSVSKTNLEAKIDSLIKNDFDIKRKKLDPPPHDNYYNKGNYFTIIIDSINFTVCYYGDSLDWNNMGDSSEIFIVKMIPSDFNKKVTKEKKLNIFEDKFINKLD